MAVFISDPDAFEKIQQIEGPNYTDNGGAYSFSAYFRAWYDYYRPYPEHISPEMTVDVDGGDGAIYGEGGYNRYIVMGDGEIIFNPLFARPEKVEQATRVGFNTGR